MTLLDQLKQEHAVLTAIKLHPETQIEKELGIGVRITYSIYTRIIKDALSTLNSLINYLAARS